MTSLPLAGASASRGRAARSPGWGTFELGLAPRQHLSLVRDLIKVETPVTYAGILAHFDRRGFVTVTGDEDDTFKP